MSVVQVHEVAFRFKFGLFGVAAREFANVQTFPTAVSSAMMIRKIGNYITFHDCHTAGNTSSLLLFWRGS